MRQVTLKHTISEYTAAGSRYDENANMVYPVSGVVPVAFDSMTEFCSAVGSVPIGRGAWATTVWESFATMSDQLKQRGAPFAVRHALSCIDKPSMFGLPTRQGWSETTKLLLGGWPEGVAQMREGIGHLSLPQAADLRRKAKWSDQGDEVSLTRYLSGSAAPWRTMTRRHVKAPPKVRLVVDLGNQCTACGDKFHDRAPTDPEAMTWRGAAACILAETLNKAGWQVEILAGEAGLPYLVTGIIGRVAFVYLVRVKAFGSPMNVAAAAALTGHAAAVRQGGNMAAAKYADDTCGTWYDNTLRLAKMPESLYARLGFPTLPNTLYIPPNLLSRADAQAWVSDALETLETRTL